MDRKTKARASFKKVVYCSARMYQIFLYAGRGFKIYKLLVSSMFTWIC